MYNEICLCEYRIAYDIQKVVRGAFCSYRKVLRKFFTNRQIERLSLYLAVLFNLCSTDVMIIKFP